MIGVLYPYVAQTPGRLVLAALRRSVSRTQAVPVARAALADGPSMLLLVEGTHAWSADLLAWLHAGRRKLVIFGQIPEALRGALGWSPRQWPDDLAAASRSEAAPAYGSSVSRATVSYGPAAALLGGKPWRRPFERFDFANEWNNLGYGSIRSDDSPWSVGVALDAGSAELAAVEIDGTRCASYVALAELGGSAILWVNRPVGVIDSFEWRLVETFFSSYRADELPCQPVLREIPWGYDAAVTSRLDCDEDVESARPLWQSYREMEVPFSLAVLARHLSDTNHHAILRDLATDGGALLSHSVTHARDWGGDYETALQEAGHSASVIGEITGRPVRYAVSPFHQTPHYALQALVDAGYRGCVGGIACNDPEFVLARGGTLAGLPDGFVGHSQQCMLHGHSLLSDGDPLQVFREAFDLAFDAATLFGYLDHPFSARYAYGWASEAQRIAAHRALIAHIRERAARPLFLNEETALDFLLFKSRATVQEGAEGYLVSLSAPHCGGLSLSLDYKGECLPVTEGERYR
ncbi:polysaccharide deacetylase family protein [Cupriavidus sp. DB3]|uniref:polysaccharide deacetylase family protein n=1 Tax=Cupriavidus sp. DB3 TaxID=2873259 RepID=UPI001CF4726A|nr:polysaccharide deacetylase family protein [Cupriavidus sp. DB3]MCA7085497.1 polysaccharide deacetylase family protein [Cupriavidus sp. DB3]